MTTQNSDTQNTVAEAPVNGVGPGDLLANLTLKQSTCPLSDVAAHSSSPKNNLYVLSVKLERENAALRAALEPFSREWASWHGKSAKAVMICEAGFSPVEAEFTQDDLQRAADILLNNPVSNAVSGTEQQNGPSNGVAL